MVARMVRDHEAMGSNPVTPTKADAKTKNRLRNRLFSRRSGFPRRSRGGLCPGTHTADAALDK